MKNTTLQIILYIIGIAAGITLMVIGIMDKKWFLFIIGFIPFAKFIISIHKKYNG